MFEVASAPVTHEDQTILLYLYHRDLKALRSQLLSASIADGGPFCGAPGPNQGRREVFGIACPTDMPQGERRVVHSDGYCLLKSRSRLPAGTSLVPSYLA